VLASWVATRRLDLARHLSRSLSGDFLVVPSPDHPLVLRSVDLLIGSRAGLTAIVMSSAEERRSPKLFNARIALNMMALPPHTVFVRVRTSEDTISSIDSAFAAELSHDDRRVRAELTQLASMPPQTRRIKQAEEAQRRSESRFADTYRLAPVLRRKSRDDLRGISTKVSRAPSRDRIAHDVEAAFFGEMPTLAAITHLIMSDAERWYGIVDGEVQPKFAAASALFVSHYPQVIGDPDKAIRAAAFAGWVMSSSQSSISQDDVGSLIQRYTRLK
jgi:hypothetical protein